MLVAMPADATVVLQAGRRLAREHGHIGSAGPLRCRQAVAVREREKDMSVSTMNRSTRPDVRNPIMRLPAAARLATLPEGIRRELRGLLMEIRRDAQELAEKQWRKHKAPMAAYWKAVAVYAGHTARALRGPNSRANARKEHSE